MTESQATDCLASAGVSAVGAFLTLAVACRE